MLPMLAVEGGTGSYCCPCWLGRGGQVVIAAHAGCGRRDRKLLLPMLAGEGGQVVISAHAGWGGVRIILRKGSCTFPSRVAVLHHFKADPDPFFFTVLRIRIRLFTLMRIRIQFLVKVMQIYDHWSRDPPQLHFDPPRLHCECPRPSK